MKPKKVTENEMFDILEKNTFGVFYYINNLGRYYCWSIRENKKTCNIWNNKDLAFNWMKNVLK